MEHFKLSSFFKLHLTRDNQIKLVHRVGHSIALGAEHLKGDSYLSGAESLFFNIFSLKKSSVTRQLIFSV